jgi:DNA-binding transcriptional regulator GbsR (MarR family)
VTAKDLIIKFLVLNPEPTPVHLMNIPGVSQCSVSARLRELRREGLVEPVQVPGKAYKAWRLAFRLELIG